MKPILSARKHKMTPAGARFCLLSALCSFDAPQPADSVGLQTNLPNSRRSWFRHSKSRLAAADALLHLRLSDC
jgi:hypothetical protein